MLTAQTEQDTAAPPSIQPGDHGFVVISAVLLAAGVLVGSIAAIFHPSGIDGNNHPMVFAQYAQSTGWTVDHLAFFVGTALTLVGLVALFEFMHPRDGVEKLVASTGMISAGAALALTAVRYAVDGVVLKRAVDTWVIAPEADKAARFASAEIARWMEEAAVSYQCYLLGLTLVLLAVLVVRTARLPRPVGYLFALSGVAYLVLGWMTGVDGFAQEGTIPALVSEFAPLVASVFLFAVVWTRPRAEGARAN